MMIFAVRDIDDKQAVGFFFVRAAEDLPYEVDAISDVEACEFQEITEPGGFAWDDHVPAIGVDRPIEKFREDYDVLMRKISPEGCLLNYFYGDDGDLWTPLSLLAADVPYSRIKREVSRSKPKREPKPERKPRPAEGPIPTDIVYFIECDGHIKIGVTSGSIKKRFHALATAHHRPLTLLATITDKDGGLEFALHQRFAAHRIRGEWFTAAPEILEYIKAEGTPP